MPHRVFNLEEVARYLHLQPGHVERLVKNQDIPCERHGGRTVFRKVDIDAWASQRILGLSSQSLAEYHQQSSQATRPLSPEGALLPGMLREEFIHPALPARTKASVLREMVALAEKTGRLWDARRLLEGLAAREELCSTGLPGGLALLHTRQHEVFLFESSFLVLGRTVHPLPFGAPDGRPTDLFFLLACPDDRLHLHTLARLCLMAQKSDLLQRLREADEAEDMLRVLVEAEESVLRREA
jgi:nitrogen PTS system EIIA component